MKKNVSNQGNTGILQSDSIALLLMPTYKDWELYEVLPVGWKIDKHCGSPLFGYDFCTDGKSIINGGKRALVKTETKKIWPVIQEKFKTHTVNAFSFTFKCSSVILLPGIFFALFSDKVNPKIKKEAA